MYKYFGKLVSNPLIGWINMQFISKNKKGREKKEKTHACAHTFQLKTIHITS